MQMRSFFTLPASLLLLVGLLTIPASGEDLLQEPLSGDDGAREAASFLVLLDDELRAEGVRPINDPERFQWTYLPGRRAGIRLGDLNAEQSRAFSAFLSATLSDAGLRRIKQLRAIEPVEDRGGGVQTGPDDYWVRFYGDPSGSGKPGTPSAWAWRLEGHHLVLNAAVVDGEVVSISPLFFGAAPHRGNARSRESVRGVEPLRGEDELAAGLLASLDPLQKARARSFEPAPRDIRSGTQKTPNDLPPEGLQLSRMNEAQRAVIDTIVGGYLGTWPKSAQRAIWMKYQSSDPAEIRFHWRGQEDRNAPHYWRISGPYLIIEYWNGLNNADHVHVVVRTRHGEFAPAP
jgi:hypothetical protein